MKKTLNYRDLETILFKHRITKEELCTELGSTFFRNGKAAYNLLYGFGKKIDRTHEILNALSNILEKKGESRISFLLVKTHKNGTIEPLDPSSI